MKHILVVLLTLLFACGVVLAEKPNSADNPASKPSSQDAENRANDLFCKAFASMNTAMIELALQQGASANARCITAGNVSVPVVYDLGKFPQMPDGIELFKRLVTSGANINKKDGEGRTLLYRAVDLAAGDNNHWWSDPVFRDKNGFKQPSSYGDWLIRYLIDNGASVTEVDNYGESLLWRVMKLGCAGIEQCERGTRLRDFLISQGLPINSKNAEGDTLLFVSAAGCGISATQFWLKSGVDPKVMNKKGKTAVDVAIAAASKYSSESDLGKRCNAVVEMIFKSGA